MIMHVCFVSHQFVLYLTKLNQNKNHSQGRKDRLDRSRADSGEASHEIRWCPMLFDHRRWEFIGHPDFCEQADQSACDDHQRSEPICE